MSSSSSSSFSSSEIIKTRFLGFLIWQSIPSTLIYLFTKLILLSPFTQTPLSPSIFTILAFFTFHLSLLLFSTSLSIVSSPRSDRAASVADLAASLFRFLLRSVSGRGSSSPDLLTPSFRRRVKTSLGFLLFLVSGAVAAALSVVSICRNSEVVGGLPLIGLGMRGFVFGLVYGVFYVFDRRWVLAFPIIQRPPCFSFKMGLPSAFRRALKLSSSAFFTSAVLMTLLPGQFKNQGTIWQFIVQQIIFFVGSSALALCWELNHHLHQVLHTKRCIFAPPKGSAAAETNPSEPLLAALEESTPNALLQYLAYLDLCMVCENNVDTWRRAAFFEETGETYKRVVAVCLRPLEELTSKLAEGLEGSSVDKTDQLSLQLHSTTDRLNAKLHESFVDLQLYIWCARIVAALTARSHTDDRFGVAQLSGSNAAVVSTLLSSLLAAEACMGKKTNIQAPNLMGPANIKWATLNTGRRDDTTSVMGKKKGGPLHAKAYAMADVLRTSIYIILSVFHDEMIGSTKVGILEKDWIISGKPLYGARELLVQKLGLFLDVRG